MMKDKTSVFTLLSVAALCAISVSLFLGHTNYQGDDEHLYNSRELTPGASVEAGSKPFTDQSFEKNHSVVQSEKSTTAGRFSSRLNISPEINESSNPIVEKVNNGNPLPPKKNQVPVTKNEEAVVIWESAALEGENGYQFQVSTDVLKDFQVGQSVKMTLPELNQTITAELKHTRNQYGDNHIFTGPLTGGAHGESITITRGKNKTYMMISTLGGAYTAEIDNQTGQAQLRNETDQSMDKNKAITPDAERIDPPQDFNYQPGG